MASQNRDISKWTRFFKSAQIPSGPAAKYAVVFVDNRIQSGMLPDLNKEYLNEMGITALGDVIAILKQAKLVYAKYEREREGRAESSSYVEEAPQASSSRPTAHDAASSRSQQQQKSVPSRKEKTVSSGPNESSMPAGLAGRLGAAPKAKREGTGAQSDKGAAVPVKRARRPMTEESDDDNSNVSKVVATKMPSNVFDRLGGKSQGSNVTSSNPVTKVIVSSPPSVFKRLGMGGPATSTSLTRDLSPPPMTPPQPQKVVVSLRSESLLQKPVVSTTTAKRSKVMEPGVTVGVKRVRLGADTLISVGSGAERTVTSRQVHGSGVKPRRKDMSATSVLGRLGLPIEGGGAVSDEPKFRVTLGTAEKAAATTTTPPVALLKSALFSDPTPAPALKNRLGSSGKLSVTVGNSAARARRPGSAGGLAKTTSSGISRRLGSAGSPTKISTAASGISRRLGSAGSPTKISTAASGINRRLGSASLPTKSCTASAMSVRLGSAGSRSHALVRTGLVSDKVAKGGRLHSAGTLSKPATQSRALAKPTKLRVGGGRVTKAPSSSHNVFSRLGAK